MKKISLMLMALVTALTMSATVVTFDFSDPKSLGITPSDTVSKGVQLKDSAITVGDVTITFNVPSGNGAKLWTAKGPAYNLRLYMPSSMILTSSGDNIRGIRVTRSQGDITELDANNEWRGDAKSVTLSVPDNGKANYISMVKVYVGEDIPSGVDTITVSEARQRIAEKNYDPCYIKGVVVSAPFIITLSSKDNYCTWLTDPENPQDSIEAFNMRKGKDAKSTYASLDEMGQDFGLLDTVLIYAEALTAFGSVYETTAGYLVETLGESAVINANGIFKYGVGALQKGKSADGVRYKYEIVLSREAEDDFDNAIHMIINSTKEKGIAGTYSIRNYMSDSSYVDGEGGIEGSLTITYLQDKGEYIEYTVKSNYTRNGDLYSIDTTYVLPGITSDLNFFTLVDDKPFIPKDGDTITCEQALSYANYLGTIVSPLNVYVRGYVVSNPTSSQYVAKAFNFYINDDPTAKSGIAQSYFCVAQNTDTVKKGDEVLLYGAIQLYKGVAEIKEGTFYSLTATGLEDVKVVANKAGARKVMLNGKMYILKDGVLYNALGAAVQ